MKVSKLSISLPAEQAEEVREMARQAGMSVSAWVAEACAARLRSTHLREFLDEWAAENGVITGEELEQARAEMERAQEKAGLRPRRQARRAG
ncbi:MAG: ribbon-helix-helix protein, CopG family [Dehalococcoidia bacterium]|nr:ribbon-helix-helix protein, CopG family [Dehalococcoidia bacterium]